jgi:hypothetical protein
VAEVVERRHDAWPARAGAPAGAHPGFLTSRLALLAALGLAAATPALTTAHRLSGLSQAESGFSAPPSVSVAAGPGYVLELANVAVRTWRDGRVVSTRSAASFFHAPKLLLTDPRVLYDTRSRRWFATLATYDADTVLLATSSSSDPTKPWTVHRLHAPGCADQPRVGVANGIVVVAANVYTTCATAPARFLGAELWTVRKADLVAGAAKPAIRTHGPTPGYFTLQPAQSLSATAPAYVVSVDDGSSTVVHLLRVSGVPPAPVTVTETATPAIALLGDPPTAAEPTGRNLQTHDNRILDAAWEDGRLWFTANASCGTPRRACGRVGELDTSAGTLSWEQDLGYAGADVFYPAARPDGSGDLVVVYGRSSPTVNPSVEAVARTPAGAFTAPLRLATSAAPAGSAASERWGDYSGAARDPSQPATVWVAGETSVGPERWGSVVAAVRLRR